MQVREKQLPIPSHFFIPSFLPLSLFRLPPSVLLPSSVPFLTSSSSFLPSFALLPQEHLTGNKFNENRVHSSPPFCSEHPTMLMLAAGKPSRAVCPPPTRGWGAAYLKCTLDEVLSNFNTHNGILP